MEPEMLNTAGGAVIGTGIVGLVFFVLRFIIVKISSDVTTMTGDSAQRGQITDLRDEIKRLEVIIREQTKSIAAMQNEVMKLRFAFIDEQSALIRILNEMSHIDDQVIKARISDEILAANKRRMAVMGNDESCKAPEPCQAVQ